MSAPMTQLVTCARVIVSHTGDRSIQTKQHRETEREREGENCNWQTKW